MGIRQLLRLPTKPSKALIKWMREPGDPRGSKSLNLSKVHESRPNDRLQEDWEKEQFFKKLGDSLRENGTPVVAAIDAQIGAGHEILGPDTPLNYIQSLGIHVSTPLALSNLPIKMLHIGSAANLRLSNCNIRELVLNPTLNADIRLRRCNIGTLRVQQGSLRHYEMQGGSLLNVDCPPPGPGNPFTGKVAFTEDVFFPRESDTYILPGPQPYRNLRYHLRALENAQMANVIHSAELAVEREDDSWTNWFVSHLYEGMSDFGSSALRPFLWLLLLYSVSVCAIFYWSGAEIPPLSDLVGWQRALNDPAWGEYWRAFYLALQPVVNPIGIFGPKWLLIPRYSELAAWLSLHGFLSLILLALLIFAIRRRFKIQA